MTRDEIDELEAHIALLRSAGCTKVPVRIDVIEAWIARARKAHAAPPPASPKQLESQTA